MDDLQGQQLQGEPSPVPIVFRGPSISLEAARRVLPQADFRAPIKRGDLDEIPAGALVGIIDGVFHQNLAISPGEVRDALQRGVTVYGASSIGALRAAEVAGVVGVGRIYQMYKTGVIERDDEVALTFDPETDQPMTVPLVNIRYAVERIVRSGTIERARGDSIIQAAAGMHYTQRTYSHVLRRAGLQESVDAGECVRLLRNYDLKRDDAQLLLETLAALDRRDEQLAVQGLMATPADDCRVLEHEEAARPLMVWEYGETVDFNQLLGFMKLTGRYESFAERALGRFAMSGRPLAESAATDQGADGASGGAQELLDGGRLAWGWETPEEAHVTMRDLGLGLDDLAQTLEAQVAVDSLVSQSARQPSDALLRALRSALWLDDLALKREALRLGALHHFARLARDRQVQLTEEDVRQARRCIARLRACAQWESTRAGLRSLGLSDAEIDDGVRKVALARRVAPPMHEGMRRRATSAVITRRAARWRALALDLLPSIKAPGTPRFSLATDAAYETATLIAKKIGLRRIGLVGELDTVGIHVAQAFGERSGWSCSFSSGKAESAVGAKVGSIMEELEIFAQDRYSGGDRVLRRYSDGPDTLPLIDPRSLDLPFDTRYHADLEIEWSECVDLISATRVRVPTAALLKERVVNDIYYCTRLGTKLFSSSGLGSGFSLAEAAVHAGAEYIERHALRLAELATKNPGRVGDWRYAFIDPSTLPETPRRIVDKFTRAGLRMHILDITSEVRVPTFIASAVEDNFDAGATVSMSSDGFACHPNPEAAVTSALLEAAQTRAGAIAGGREDFSLKARSLGRHERPRAMSRAAQSFYFGNDRPLQDFADSDGIVTRDILEELEWMVDRVAAAGFSRFLLVNHSSAQTSPGYAVRVIIPGMESTNPFFTGDRARALSLSDLLPRELKGARDAD